MKQSGQTDKIYYACKDHPGSIVKLVDGNGTEVFKASYGAWGKQTVTNSTFQFYRGYTGHEHLPELALINMKGRVYDPVRERFMGMDPYVQTPDFTQSYNRYAYGLNNPLIYADPDGEWIEYVIAAVFLYVMNAYNNGDKTRDENGHQRRNYDLGSWAWNPLDWFKSTPENPNPSVVVTVTGNSDGDISGSIAAGNPNSSMPAIGYSNNQGLGFGYSYNGNTNMYYPGYNYNAPEQAAARAYENLRTSNWDWSFYAGTGMTAISETVFSQELGTWMGKNGKFYDQNWGGNQYTGGKYKFANNFAKPFKWGSSALGIYGIYSSISNGFDGKISPAEVTGDVIFGGAAIYSGFYGGWANFWYNLGKEYGPMTTYLSIQRKREAERNKSVFIEYMREKGYLR